MPSSPRYAPLFERDRRSNGSADDLDDVPCGLLTFFPSGQIAEANRRLGAWLGFKKEDLIGKRLHELLSVPARVFFETNISPLLRIQGSVDEIAMDFLAADGARVQMLVNGVERRDATGAHTDTLLAVFRAVERRRYERTLVETRADVERAVAAEREASKLREQFIAVLGHDLRNPLAAIGSGVRLLTDRETVSPRGQRILALMEGSVKRATELVDDVMDFARGRLGGGITLNRDALEPLGPALNQVVEEIAAVAVERAIRCDIDIGRAIDCDRVRIGQLLSNLLGNAVTHGSKTEPIIVRATTTDDALTISVANGGIPIDEVTRSRLFHPFFRGESGPNRVGLGLGLHIASEIARAHGGVLEVMSDQNETRFTFSMPLQQSEFAC